MSSWSVILIFILDAVISLKVYYWILGYAFQRGWVSRKYKWADEEGLPSGLGAIYCFFLAIIFIVTIFFGINCSNNYRISYAKLAAGEVTKMTSRIVYLRFSAIENPKKVVNLGENFALYSVFNGTPNLKEGDKILVLYYPEDCEKCELDFKVSFTYPLDKQTPLGIDLERVVKRSDIGLSVFQL